GIVPCLLMIVGLFLIPESPRWLAKVGREEESESALLRLRGNESDVTREAHEIQESIEMVKGIPKIGILDLFESKNLRRPLIIGVGLMIFQQFGGVNGIGFYSTHIFLDAGFSERVGTICYALIQIPFTVLGAMLMDKSGRRPLIMISSLGMCIGCALSGTSFYLKEENVWVPSMTFAGLIVYVSSFSIGMGAGPWVIMSEIFPIHMKGIGGSLVVVVSWLGAWIVSFTFNFLNDWSSAGTFFLYGGVCASAVAFAGAVVPETKGKTLEEIQELMD
ncbi:hypothetical protein M569_11497, partial [Genlisea aurea]